MVRQMRDHARVVLCTCPDTSTAERLADGLLARRLAGCVNILPAVRSLYYWEERLEQAEEVQLIIKTTGTALPGLQKYIEQQHPYEVPEIIAIPVVAGLPAYLKWLEDACD
jgi:periplasmic divalent cation tolerance protein